MGVRAQRCVVCRVVVPVGMAAGLARAAAAHWLARLADGFAGVAGVVGGASVAALAVRRLDSAAAGDGGARFAVCFILVVRTGGEVCSL